MERNSCIGVLGLKFLGRYSSKAVLADTSCARACNKYSSNLGNDDKTVQSIDAMKMISQCKSYSFVWMD